MFPRLFIKISPNVVRYEISQLVNLCNQNKYISFCKNKNLDFWQLKSPPFGVKRNILRVKLDLRKQISTHESKDFHFFLKQRYVINCWILQQARLSKNSKILTNNYFFQYRWHYFSQTQVYYNFGLYLFVCVFVCLFHLIYLFVFDANFRILY